MKKHEIIQIINDAEEIFNSGNNLTRLGEAFFQALGRLDSRKYEEMAGGDGDCFYLDTKLFAFLRKIIQEQ